MNVEPAASACREAVADAGGCAQQPAGLAQLLAQAVNVDAQVLRLGPVRVTPHLPEDHLVRARLAGMACKVRQELELLCRELDYLAVQRGLEVGQVELQGPDREALVAGGRPARVTKGGAGPSLQL